MILRGVTIRYGLRIFGGALLLSTLITAYAGSLHTEPTTNSSMRGALLGSLTWSDAEKVLTPDNVVVIPIRAESKKHGPHLELRNDLLRAEYFRSFRLSCGQGL